jgi:DNA-binding transcriptional regulator YiaG
MAILRRIHGGPLPQPSVGSESSQRRPPGSSEEAAQAAFGYNSAFKAPLIEHEIAPGSAPLDVIPASAAVKKEIYLIRGNPMITIEQVKVARKLLGWSQDVFAVNAGVSQTTVAHFETGTRVEADSIALNLLKALECAGIEFAADEARVTLRRKSARP